MLVEIDANSISKVVAQELKEMIDNKANIRKREVQAARQCLTYFLSYEEWSALDEEYRKGVEW